MKELGVICPECESPVKYPELDRFTGKRRNKFECEECKNVFKRKNAEKYYSEGEIASSFTRNYEMLDNILAKAEEESDGCEECVKSKRLVKARKRQLESLARQMDVWSNVEDGDKIEKCIICGETNSVSRKRCNKCDNERWRPSIESG